MNIAAMATSWMAQDKVASKPKSIIVRPANKCGRAKGHGKVVAERLRTIERNVSFEPVKAADIGQKLGYTNAQQLRDDIRALVKLGRVRTLHFGKDSYLVNIGNKKLYCRNKLQQTLYPMLIAGKTAIECSNELGLGQSTIGYQVRLLVENGLIKQASFDGRFKRYKATKEVGFVG